MATEVEIVKDNATTVFINHPTASYGIFCYNEKGDLFLNSDWGMFGYAWRHFGSSTFEEFLAGANAEYLAGKFAINYNQSMPRAKFGSNREKNVTILLDEFIKFLKEKINN